jgi:sugar/nucleoside kinase (ribokinase family)
MNGPVECPVECVTFSNVIVDDIVLWDGRTLMGALGGGGTHALVGMRVWGARPRNGFVAWTGVDFDPAMRAQLERIDVDPSGLYERPDPTTRAWQIIERDDRRTEIFRTDLAAFVRNSPTLANIPAAWLRARGMHLMTNGTVAQHIEFVAGLRRVAPDMVLVFEPAPEHDGARIADYGDSLAQLTLFSPDIDQARALTGCDDVEDMAKTMLDAGAPLVAIRMGARGSYVRGHTVAPLYVPAVPPRVLVDVTGAGNAYCGGFTVSLARGYDAHEAALRAAVSASFALEQFGVPHFGPGHEEEAARRLEWCRATSDSG